MLSDEELAIRRGHAVFEADVARTLRVIAERYHAAQARLCGDTLRAIVDEALADVGLASRWPPELLDALTAGLDLPGGESTLSTDQINRLGPLVRPVLEAFALPPRA